MRTPLAFLVIASLGIPARAAEIQGALAPSPAYTGPYTGSAPALPSRTGLSGYLVA